MKNISHNNTWNLGMTQVHVEPTLTPLLKSKQGDKSEKIPLKKNCVGIWHQLRWTVVLFDNGDPVEFFLFVQKFNTTLVESGTLATGAKIQHIHTLVHGEALCQFDSLSAKV